MSLFPNNNQILISNKKSVYIYDYIENILIKLIMGYGNYCYVFDDGKRLIICKKIYLVCNETKHFNQEWQYNENVHLYWYIKSIRGCYFILLSSFFV